MSNGFDAYHKWLSIPPHEQPPNHYRLLGLGLFESDPDVISAAGDRQMAHVQTYKTGPHSALSQQLLNEIASAKICLLRPEKKAVYDSQLRQQIPQQQPAPVTLSAMATPTAPKPVYSGMPVAPPPTTPPSTMPPPALLAPPVHSRPLTTATLLLIASATMTILLFVGIVVLLANRSSRSSATPNAVHTPAQPSKIPSSISQNDSEQPNVVSMSSQTAAKPVTATASKSPRGVAIGAVGNQPAVVKSPSQPTIRPSPSTGNKVAPTIAANSGTKQASAAVGTAGSGGNSAKPLPDSLLAGKTPVPDQATLDALAKQISTPLDAKPAEILDQAHKATDAAQAYVLLRRTLERTVEQGDAATAISAADELVRRFAVDSVALHWQTFDDLQAHVQTPDSWSALGSAASTMLDDPAVGVRADLSRRVAELSITAARRSGNADTIRKVTLRILRTRSGTPPVAIPKTSS